MIQTEYSMFNYLTVSEDDKLWGLYVTGSGSADIPPRISYPPTQHPNTYMFDWSHGRKLPEFQVIYITRGGGTFESKPTGRKRISEGTILMLFPGIWHRYRPNPLTGWKEYWISFHGSQPQALLKEGIITPEKAVLEIGLNEMLIQLYGQVLSLLQSETIGYKAIIASLAYQILAQVIAVEHGKQFVGNDIEIVIQKAKAHMADNVDKRIECETLAGELGVGYSWFRRMFREYTGLAPTQYFLQLKLNKAKDLLIGTSLPVKKISAMTGFESQYYFSKFFKKRMGMSPIQLRNYSRGERKR